MQRVCAIADLCLALNILNISRGTLQYSFQDVLDINSVRYLKAIRLNQARRDLRANSAIKQPLATLLPSGVDPI